jgi:NAD(P)-dependent dehydrogenase (short-subunit alcohol dehydrogenase family)
MNSDLLQGKRILITGGTSGLGKSLAVQLKNRVKSITVIGKNRGTEQNEGLYFVKSDLADFDSVMDVVKKFSSQNSCFDVLINNAGILSPPKYYESVDGFELSYQVNFLSHVLLTRLLIRHQLLNEPTIINVTSPIYVKGNIREGMIAKHSYNVLRAYADSKLYMVLFSELLATEGISGFAFNPGTFSSAIYRSQSAWFHLIYKIAAPFMVTSRQVATKLIRIIEEGKFTPGKIIGKSGSESSALKFTKNEQNEFWKVVNSQLDGYL